MKINISNEAAAWYIDELDLTPVHLYAFSCVTEVKVFKVDFH